jgi:hypothetical protein
VSPIGGTAADLQDGGTFQFTYNPGADSGVLQTWRMRRKIGAGAYTYFDVVAQTWTSSTPVDNPVSYLTLVTGTPGSTACTYSYTFASGLFTNGNTYSYSVSTKESYYSLDSGFATDSTVVATNPPTVVINTPFAYQATPSIAVTWTDTLTGGSTQSGYQLALYTQAQIQSPSFIPGTTKPIYAASVLSTATTATIGPNAPSPIMIDGGIYYLYMRILQSDGLYSAWTFSNFVNAWPGPAAPSIIIQPSVDPFTSQPTADLHVAALFNRLVEANSNFESGTIGTMSGAGPIGTPVVSTAWAVSGGTGSLQVTSTGSGAASLDSGLLGGAGTVTPGQILSAMATAQQPSLTQTITLGVTWYSASFTNLGSQAITSAAASTSGVSLLGSVTVPATFGGGVPMYASIHLSWTTTGTGQITRFDELAIFCGAATVTAWSLGGFYGATLLSIEVQHYNFANGQWEDVYGSTGLTVDPVLGITAIDYAATYGVVAQYRARVVGYSAGISRYVVSLWSAMVWISDPTTPHSAVGCLLDSDWSPVIHEEMQVYYPIGRANGVKSTDGTKGLSGSVSLLTSTDAQRKSLEALLAGTETLLLQLPTESHYVAIDGDRQGSVLWTTQGVKAFSRSSISFAYIEVPAPS